MAQDSVTTRKSKLFYDQIQANNATRNGNSSRTSSQTEGGSSERSSESDSAVERSSVARANVGAVISFTIPIVSRIPTSGVC